MKKTFVLGVALAASLLTACGGEDGTAAPSSTSTSTTASSSPSSTSTSTSTSTSSSATSSSEDTSSASQSSDDASATGAPVELDEQSTAWFSTFCNSTVQIQQASSAMGQMQPDPSAPPADTQAALATGVKDFGNTFKTAAADIAAQPAPTIEGGDQLATGATDAYNKIGDDLIAAGDKFAATPVTDQASLQAAATTLATEIQASVQGIQEAVAPLDGILTDELGESVSQIPGCEEIAGS